MHYDASHSRSEPEVELVRNFTGMLPVGTVAGSTILVHAIYSVYEWAYEQKQLTALTTPALPFDMKVEIASGLLLIIVSTIFQQVSRMELIKIPEANVAKTLAAEEPFAHLESRPNFQDLVAKRQAFLEWRRSSAK